MLKILISYAAIYLSMAVSNQKALTTLVTVHILIFFMVHTLPCTMSKYVNALN